MATIVNSSRLAPDQHQGLNARDLRYEIETIVGTGSALGMTAVSSRTALYQHRDLSYSVNIKDYAESGALQWGGREILEKSRASITIRLETGSTIIKLTGGSFCGRLDIFVYTEE
ncbi:hypothetical protein EVAR_28274_1 [Eumeta japonica]|uniref:Uncharacterized protein n=1 Tax=Eumeta variegata TaxID=151549 RepID=A0A4C1V680_EUMVA|nr:hypothetical protein EVAR_28274_1 [Eumeta japonica]